MIVLVIGDLLLFMCSPSLLQRQHIVRGRTLVTKHLLTEFVSFVNLSSSSLLGTYRRRHGPVELIFHQLLLVQNSSITRHLRNVKLVHANDLLVKVCDTRTVVNLLLSVQVDGTVVDAELVLPEERNSNLLQVKEHNLSEHLCTANLSISLLKTLRQQRNTVNFLFLRHKEAATGLQSQKLALITGLLRRQRQSRLIPLILLIDSAYHGFEVHDLPLDETLQNLVRIFHGLRQVLQLFLKMLLVLMLEQNVLRAIILHVAHAVTDEEVLAMIAAGRFAATADRAGSAKAIGTILMMQADQVT